MTNLNLLHQTIGDLIVGWYLVYVLYVHDRLVLERASEREGLPYRRLTFQSNAKWLAFPWLFAQLTGWLAGWSPRCVGFASCVHPRKVSDICNTRRRLDVPRWGSSCIGHTVRCFIANISRSIPIILYIIILVRATLRLIYNRPLLSSPLHSSSQIQI